METYDSRIYFSPLDRNRHDCVYDSLLDMVEMIFISFVEEAVMSPKYAGYVAGRVEVWHPGDDHSSEELRFFTNDISGYTKFRNRWDFETISVEEYKRFKRLLSKYREEIE